MIAALLAQKEASMLRKFIDTHPVLVRSLITLIVLSMLVISAGAPRGYGG